MIKLSGELFISIPKQAGTIDDKAFCDGCLVGEQRLSVRRTKLNFVIRAIVLATLCVFV